MSLCCGVSRKKKKKKKKKKQKPKKLFEGVVENFSSSRRVGREREELFKKLGGLGYSSFLCTVYS